MSTNFINLFNVFFKILSIPKLESKSINYSSNLLTFLLGSGIHVFYTYGTEKKENIQVVNKYKMVKYGSTQFMLVDNNGRHYNVNNSIWYWKWDSIEDWNKIKNGNEIAVKYYGLRIPFLGFFPNIVKSD
jgi:hypothetical protein